MRPCLDWKITKAKPREGCKLSSTTLIHPNVAIPTRSFMGMLGINDGAWVSTTGEFLEMVKGWTARELESLPNVGTAAAAQVAQWSTAMEGILRRKEDEGPAPEQARQTPEPRMPETRIGDEEAKMRFMVAAVQGLAGETNALIPPEFIAARARQIADACMRQYRLGA